MYMKVMFCSKKGTVITRTEIIELPEIRGTNLTSEETFSCDDKAESLCRDGERVSGWKLLEEYEVNKEENKMKVYVLAVSNSGGCCRPDVFDSKEKAVNAMKEAYDSEIEEWLNEDGTMDEDSPIEDYNINMENGWAYIA